MKCFKSKQIQWGSGLSGKSNCLLQKQTFWSESSWILSEQNCLQLAMSKTLVPWGLTLAMLRESLRGQGHNVSHDTWNSVGFQSLWL